jgi:hypothetical protein
LPSKVAAERAERELHEMYDFGGAQPRLATDDAWTVLDMLDGLEDGIDQAAGWDAPPCLYLLRGDVGPLGNLVALAVKVFHIPRSTWAACDWDAGVMLGRFAELAVEQPRFGEVLLNSVVDDRPKMRLVGVAAVVEAWVRNDTSDLTRTAKDTPYLRADEVRIVNAVDVDMRQYHVQHSRVTGQRIAMMRTTQEWRRHIAAMDDNVGEFVRSGPDAMPRAPRGLLAMVRCLLEETDESRR